MIITGIQPTGKLHLGNYLGAIKPTIALQKSTEDDEDTYIFIADYHAITAGFDPAELKEARYDLAAMILACGFDASRVAGGCLFLQSDVPEHTELAHILNCTAARVGQLNRMIQFKEKMAAMGENSESPSVGLFTYPVLQAADILLYQEPDRPTRVPIGDDQMQHLNLVIDIAQSFNHRFGETFSIPVPLVSNTPRIMSLYDGTKKMSKSDPDDMNRINMSDPADLIAKKYRKATTDQFMIPASVEEIGDRHGLRNLLTIYAALMGVELAVALDDLSGRGFGDLKKRLTEATVAALEPIQQRYAEIRPRAPLQHSLSMGAQNVQIIASETLRMVKSKIGMD